MARTIGPCLSLRASGTIGDFITFRNRGNLTIAERKPDRPPENPPIWGKRRWPRSSTQGNQRDIFKALGHAWRYLSADEQKSWEPLAKKRRSTLVACYTQENIRSFREGGGMSFMYPASMSPYGMNVTATGTLYYGRAMQLRFDSPDPSELFFLVIGHFAAASIGGGFATMKALHFWRPDPKYYPDSAERNPPEFTEFHRTPGRFEWDYYEMQPSINYIPWAVGLRSGYLHSGCISLL